MSFKERECSTKKYRNDVLPCRSPTQLRSGAVILAAEFARAADLINWPRVPGLKEFEAMADHMIAASYYGTEEFIGTSNADSAQ